MTVVGAVLAVWVNATGCATEPPGRAPAGERRMHKPTAPVVVTLQTVARGGAWDVTAVATVTRDVDGLELGVGGVRSQLGAVRAGETRVLSTSATQGGQVVAEARTTVGGKVRSAAAVAWLGARPVAQQRPVEHVTLPGGIGVAEVRQ